MAIADEIADGLSELETDFPATFIWNGTAYDCIAGSETRGVDAGELGLMADDDLTLIVQLGQFGTGTKPTQRNIITFNSRDYRIQQIEKAPQEAFSIYRCEVER